MNAISSAGLVAIALLVCALISANGIVHKLVEVMP